MEKSTIHEYKGRGLFEPAINIKDYLLIVIAEKGPITRSKLTNFTGIPRTTIYDSIVKLILQGRINKSSVYSRKRGRPRVVYEVASK